MVTWTEAQDKVRRDLWRPSSTAIPDDQVDRALHSALHTLESERRWLWLDNLSSTLTMASEADNIALPATARFITSIAYLSGDTGYDVLQLKPIHQIRELAQGAAVGSPAYYARVGDTLYFDCLVANADDFEIVYSARCPVALADAKATPPVTLTLQTPTVVAWAAGHVAQTFLHDDEKARRQFLAYERLLYALETAEDAARSDGAGGGCIQPDDFYFNAAHGS